MEKADIDNHTDKMDKILKDALEKEKKEHNQGDQESLMKEAKPEQEFDSDGEPKNNVDINISQDSASKNVGVLGQYISRVIIDKEQNPDKYEHEEQDYDELIKKQL